MGKGLGWALTAKQVAIKSSLIHDSGVNSIALLEDILGRRPLVNEAGDPRLLAGFLDGLGNVVEDEDRSDGARCDVEAALLCGNGRVSQVVVRGRGISCSASKLGSGRSGRGRRAYAEAFVHGLMGGVRAPAALGAQQLPRRRSRSSGSEHCVEEAIGDESMTLWGVMIGRGGSGSR